MRRVIVAIATCLAVLLPLGIGASQQPAAADWNGDWWCLPGGFGPYKAESDEENADFIAEDGVMVGNERVNCSLIFEPATEFGSRSVIDPESGDEKNPGLSPGECSPSYVRAIELLSPVGNAPDWATRWSVFFNRCLNGSGTKYVKVNRLQIRWKKQPTGAACGWLGSIRTNPNIIGGWNPGPQTVTCSNSVSTRTVNWTPPNKVSVYGSQTQANKCVAPLVSFYDTGGHRQGTFTYPTICMRVPW